MILEKALPLDLGHHLINQNSCEIVKMVTNRNYQITPRSSSSKHVQTKNIQLFGLYQFYWKIKSISLLKNSQS